MSDPTKTPKIFGAGRMYGVNNVSCPTPVVMDTLQEMTLSIKRDLKKLYGRNQFAADVSAGSADVTWKATLGSLTGRVIADQIGGVAANSAQRWNTADREQRVVGTQDGAFYTRAINGGNAFLQNLGVINPATNQPLIRVPLLSDLQHATQYVVSSTGRYDFHSSMLGHPVLLSYKWSGNADGLGNLLSITNKPMGKIGNFSLVMAFESGDGEENVVTLNSNIMSDFELGSKGGDYGKPTLAGAAMVDANDNLGSISFAQRN